MRPASHTRVFSALFFACCLLPGASCAGAAPRVSEEPLNNEQARLFEHGVDFIGRLGGLEGRWLDDWNRDLQQRVAESDLIAIVVVRRERTDKDPDNGVTHRLYGEVERTLRGNQPKDLTIELAVRQSEPGFVSVDDNLGRLQDARLVAYVRRYRTETGAIANHFHLSPASDEVVLETEARLAALASH
jgi:hypothetical protein